MFLLLLAWTSFSTNSQFAKDLRDHDMYDITVTAAKNV